jgi:hypothetical protein
MATLFNPFYRAIDSSGNPMLSAQLYFYGTGTSTPANTYNDVALSVTNSNPVIADAGGLFGSIYLDATTTYKAVLKDSSGSTIQTLDPVFSLTPAAISAALGYAPGNNSGSITNFLSADVPMLVTGTFVNGPNTGAIGGSGQEWLIIAQAGVSDSVGAATFSFQVHDGTNVVSTAGCSTGGAGFGSTATFDRKMTLSGPTTYTLKAANFTRSGGTLSCSNDSGVTKFATGITAIRLS